MFKSHPQPVSLSSTSLGTSYVSQSWSKSSFDTYYRTIKNMFDSVGIDTTEFAALFTLYSKVYGEIVENTLSTFISDVCCICRNFLRTLISANILGLKSVEVSFEIMWFDLFKSLITSNYLCRDVSFKAIA